MLQPEKRDKRKEYPKKKEPLFLKPSKERSRNYASSFDTLWTKNPKAFRSSVEGNVVKLLIRRGKGIPREGKICC